MSKLPESKIPEPSSKSMQGLTVAVHLANQDRRISEKMREELWRNSTPPSMVLLLLLLLVFQCLPFVNGRFHRGDRHTIEPPGTQITRLGGLDRAKVGLHGQQKGRMVGWCNTIFVCWQWHWSNSATLQNCCCSQKRATNERATFCRLQKSGA